MAKKAKRKLKASPERDQRRLAALAARNNFKREIALQREVSALMRKLRRTVLETDANLKDFLVWLSARHEEITGVFAAPSSTSERPALESAADHG